MTETLVASTPDAPWLPPGGRADVVRSEVAPAPVGLVRLLVRRDDTVFCTTRDDGRLDLPTAPVEPSDPTGVLSATALARTVLGDAHGPVVVVGFVRNVVERPTPRYPWPAPLAHFVVWTAAGSPVVPGRWVDAVTGQSPLRDRHWWLLVDG